ncbi:hypothetical protein INR49_013000, partial [Caranx melampygus]
VDANILLKFLPPPQRSVDRVLIDNTAVEQAVFWDLLIERNRAERYLQDSLGFCAETGWKVIFTIALVPSTVPGRLYSSEPVSPPGLGDLRRASSLTNKHCVGLKEKPPRRCQNKADGYERCAPPVGFALVPSSPIHM